jgi:type VI secretion system protein
MAGLLARLEHVDANAHSVMVDPIVRQLQHLLNTRVGDAPAMPGYGLPDVDSFDCSEETLVKTLADKLVEVIRQYEPRLECVKVRAQSMDHDDGRLVFVIEAEKAGISVAYHPTLKVSGQWSF